MKTDKGVSVKACVRCAGQEMSWNPPIQLPLSIISLNSDFKSFYTNMFFISEIVFFFFSTSGFFLVSPNLLLSNYNENVLSTFFVTGAALVCFSGGLLRGWY